MCLRGVWRGGAQSARMLILITATGDLDLALSVKSK